MEDVVLPAKARRRMTIGRMTRKLAQSITRLAASDESSSLLSGETALLVRASQPMVGKESRQILSASLVVKSMNCEASHRQTTRSLGAILCILRALCAGSSTLVMRESTALFHTVVPAGRGKEEDGERQGAGLCAAVPAICSGGWCVSETGWERSTFRWPRCRRWPPATRSTDQRSQGRRSTLALYLYGSTRVQKSMWCTQTVP
jgi:hypothetical protein